MSSGLISVAQFRLAQIMCALHDSHASVVAANAALAEALAERSTLAMLTGTDGARLRETLEAHNGGPLEGEASAVLRRLAALFDIDDPVCAPLAAAASADRRWHRSLVLADALRGLPPL